jgi:hypothetical protein
MRDKASTSTLINTKREREKALARRARRAADVRRCRARQARGAACYYVECDAETFNLMVRFEGLDPDRITDRQAAALALGKLLRRVSERR